MQTVSITPKWQIHIPVSIREELGLTTPAQADMYVHGDTFIVKPKRSKILFGSSIRGQGAVVVLKSLGV